MKLSNLHRVHLTAKYCTKEEAILVQSWGCSQLAFDLVGVPTELNKVRSYIDKKKRRAYYSASSTFNYDNFL